MLKSEIMHRQSKYQYILDVRSGPGTSRDVYGLWSFEDHAKTPISVEALGVASSKDIDILLKSIRVRRAIGQGVKLTATAGGF